MIRSPLARPSTLHSDRSTRHIYELECSLTDDPSRSIAREVIDHMPNAVGVVVLGEPAYETVVEGGGALQSGWFEDKGMCVRPQVGSGHDPHYQRIGIGWSLQRELLKVNNDVVDVLREAVGPGIHIPRITTRDDLEAMTSFTIASQASQRTVYDENVGEEFLESLDRSIQDELDASDRKEVIEYLQQEARRSSLSSGKLKGTKRSLEAAARNGNMSTGMWRCQIFLLLPSNLKTTTCQLADTTADNARVRVVVGTLRMERVAHVAVILMDSHISLTTKVIMSGILFVATVVQMGAGARVSWEQIIIVCQWMVTAMHANEMRMKVGLMDQLVNWIRRLAHPTSC